MIAADSLHARVHGLVLSGVSAPCRRACSASAFALHFALHPVGPFGVLMAALLATDPLHVAVHLIVPSGVSFCCSSPCRRACRAGAFAPHFTLPAAQPSHVQASCLEHGGPAAIAVFTGARAARAALPPGRSCRERMREANAEGKIEGRGTTVRAMPVCTWVWRGTRHREASCRQWRQGLAGIGNTVCRMRSGAMGLAGAAS